jgi:hypothetical protein
MTKPVMQNPFNPLNWLKSTQDWFSKTERSSGFRPYLIFVIVHVGFVITLLACFPDSEVTSRFAVNSLYISFVGFVALYIFKAIQDPKFCRSEKHVETVTRLELQEEKGDAGPSPIDVSSSEVIPNPEVRELPPGMEGHEQ